MELHDYLKVIRSRKWLIVVSVVFTVAAALAASYIQTPMYEAEANLLASEGSGGSAALEAAMAGFSAQPERALQTQVRMLRMRPAFERTIRRLDLRMLPEELMQRAEISAEGQTNIISIRISDSDPDRAAEIANVLAEEYSLWAREFSRTRIRAAAEQVEQQLAEVRAELVEAGSGKNLSDRDKMALQVVGQDYAGLSEQLRQLRIREEMEVGPVQVVNAAAVPAEPDAPKPLRNGAIALVLGLVLGGGAAFVTESLDRTVKDADQASELLEAPVLGIVPLHRNDKSALVGLDETAANPVAESIRTLRHSLDFVNFDQRTKTVLVTSSAPGEGKSTLAANLAVSLARAGRRVILVSVDFHRPKAASYLGLNETLGLSHVLTGQAGLEMCLQKVGESGLRVLASGKVPPNPSELLGSERMRDLIKALEGVADWVILDGPPVLAVADATAVAKWADGTVVVVRAGSTHREALKRAVATLNGVGAKLLGAVVIGGEDPGSAAGSYGYAHSYASRRKAS